MNCIYCNDELDPRWVEAHRVIGMNPWEVRVCPNPMCQEVMTQEAFKWILRSYILPELEKK